MIHSGFITAGDRVAQRFLNFAWTQLFAWLHSGLIGRSHDSFYPRHKTVKLTKWHYAEKSMNVRVYISPFSQCQCWLFSSVYSLANLYRRPSLLRTFLSFIFFFWDSRQQKYKLRTKNRVKETSQRQKCFSCGWKKTSRETKCKSFRAWEIAVLFVLVMWTCGAC